MQTTNTPGTASTLKIIKRSVETFSIENNMGNNSDMTIAPSMLWLASQASEICVNLSHSFASSCFNIPAS